MEPILFVILLICAIVPLLGKLRRWPIWFVTLFACASVSVAVGAGAWYFRVQERLERERQYQQSLPKEIPHSSYVSSDSCKACHPDEYHSWHQSFHRTMTQPATPETVLGDFNNVTLELRGETFRFTRRGDEFWVEMPDPDWKAEQTRLHGELDWSKLKEAPRVEKRVGMLTGSHTLQKYWVPSKHGNMQFDLPFTWLIEDKRWVAREDSIVRDPNLPLLVQVWNMNCIKCHTTGARPNRDQATGKLDTHVGEFGIACEACHGPAEQHVELSRELLYRYDLRKSETADPHIVDPAKLSAKRSSEVCGQCHAIKISLEPDWEKKGSAYRPGNDLDELMAVVLPARPRKDLPGFEDALKDSEVTGHFFWPDGMTRITGREYNGLVQTPCFERGTMSCLSCHSIHKSDPNDQLALGMLSNQACTQCHTDDRFTVRLEEHTRHKTDSSGSLCYNCHMPHTTWGLLKAVRSHQITNPSVQSSLDTGRPNACNLCHLDQSLGWTAGHLSKWYGQDRPALDPDQESISAAVQWALKGEAGQRALIAWHMGWESARQASGTNWMAPILAELADDPYAAVRYRAGKALRLLPGREEIPYDFVGPKEQRAQIKNQLLSDWEKLGADELDRKGIQVLIDPDGRFQRDTFDRLLQQRDHRSIFLIE